MSQTQPRKQQKIMTIMEWQEFILMKLSNMNLQTVVKRQVYTSDVHHAC